MAEELINDRYIQYLQESVVALSDDGSLMKMQTEEINKLFLKFGFTNEQMAEIVGKMFATSTQYINQYATAGAIELIKEEKKSELISAQIEKVNAEILLVEAQIKQADNQAVLIESQKDLIDRQIKGYDDNIISKAAEFQGGLASFAVNAGSDDAQSAIDQFMCTINEFKYRIDGYKPPDPACPAEETEET